MEIPEMRIQSTLTCPECGFSRSETMPTDACQFYYECTGCGALLRPKKGDCCVYCSFGTAPCPPVQNARSGDGLAGCCES
jgi:rubredoxin